MRLLQMTRILLRIPAWLLACCLAFAAFPALSQNEEGRTGWYKRSHSYRLEIWTASTPESRTAYVDFHSGGKCQPDGRDILITDETGRGRTETHHAIRSRRSFRCGFPDDGFLEIPRVYGIQTLRSLLLPYGRRERGSF